MKYVFLLNSVVFLEWSDLLYMLHGIINITHLYLCDCMLYDFTIPLPCVFRYTSKQLACLLVKFSFWYYSLLVL